MLDESSVGMDDKVERCSERRGRSLSPQIGTRHDVIDWFCGELGRELHGLLLSLQAERGLRFLACRLAVPDEEHLGH